MNEYTFLDLAEYSEMVIQFWIFGELKTMFNSKSNYKSSRYYTKLETSKSNDTPMENFEINDTNYFTFKV